MKTKPKYIYVLRTCKADMTSHQGFRWPKRGPVEAKDWRPTYLCGHGLHGLPWAVGSVGYLDLSDNAKWLVVRAETKDLRMGRGELQDKCKFRKGGE